MAVGDQGAAPEKKGLPLWVILAGGGALALFLYLRARNSGGGVLSSLSGTPAATGGVATDPNTGLPIDPLTGLPYLTGTGAQPTSLSDWVSNAETQLVKAGFDPALVGQALYDYTNSNPLSPLESHAIDRALALSGFPPVALPFLGTTPTTGPTGTPTPATPPATKVGAALNPHNYATNLPGFGSVMNVIGQISGGKVQARNVTPGTPVYALVNTGYGPIWEQFFNASKLPTGTRVAVPANLSTALR